MKFNVKRLVISSLVVAGLAFAGMSPAAAQSSPIRIEDSKAIPANLPKISYNGVDLYKANVSLTLTYKYGGGSPGADKSEDTIEAKPTTAGISISMDSVVYSLDNITWRTPAEHSLSIFDKENPLLVQQMQFRGPDGKLVVFSTTFLAGKSQSSVTLANIFNNMPVPGASPTTLYNVSLGSLLVTEGLRYDYVGSLTSSPQAQNVKWVVFKKSLKVDPSTVEKFQSLLPYGANGAALEKQLPSTVVYTGNV